jgi:L-methionine (R)-S-oxide reductase
MAEDLIIPTGDRFERYELLFPQIQNLIQGEPDLIANMANVCGALHEVFHFLWVGFYRRIGEELVLGPFQGPVACTRIPLGKGVCGLAAAEARTVIVPDVESFPGHIACSSRSKSEIVVPLIIGGRVTGVLDVDSQELDYFSEVDKIQLERIASLFGGKPELWS